MSVLKALEHKDNLEKLNENWEKQGLDKNQRRVRIHTYLDEMKRKHLKEQEG